MRRQTIPVPAESLRTLAENATDSVRKERERGNHSSARDLEQQIGKAFSALDGRDGEFISIEGSAVSTLCAYSDYEADGVLRHSRAAEVFLKQYDIWS